MIKIFMRANPGEFVNYVNALTACGAEPVLSMDLSLADECDGLLVPGGADVNPVLYGQENTASYGIDDDKDRDEIFLVRKFVSENKPVLGICRGHQVINVALGGDMIQNVPDAPHHVSLGERGDNIHEARALHPFIRDLYGEDFVINSSHHQAVDRLADGLLPTCVSDDGILEGFVHENGRVIGVQFHPERIGFAHRRPDTVNGEAIFHAFFALF
ncbi:MAG: gamma-glutamyl-gamma-aminobutyrate hydrolase family protein [Clostridia bacterium]|nr:gamma-glutamyl-gamma-aminobutyrate hydrolase family protein [Clostridia bacterium]